MVNGMPKRCQERDEARRRRRMKIRESDVGTICKLILDSHRPMTWGEIVAEAARQLSHTWTRQALERHGEIKKAYTERRRRKGNGPTDPAIILLTQKVAGLKAEIESLVKRLALYDAKFVRYQYNAHARGVSPAELDQQLPPIKRRRSDG